MIFSRRQRFLQGWPHTEHREPVADQGAGHVSQTAAGEPSPQKRNDPMRVLLVYPTAKKEIIGWGDKGAIAEPIALEYIAAAARAEGHDVMLLDLRLHNERLDTTLL